MILTPAQAASFLLERTATVKFLADPSHSDIAVVVTVAIDGVTYDGHGVDFAEAVSQAANKYYAREKLAKTLLEIKEETLNVGETQKLFGPIA